jgi:hypothetical protein
MILTGHAESIKLSAPPAKGVILSAPPVESMTLSARAESIILSVQDGTSQQSTKSCSRKCGNNGGGRGGSGGSNRFDIGCGNDDHSDNSNGNSNGGDSDIGNCDSSNNYRAESIMLSASGAESIILSGCGFVSSHTNTQIRKRRYFFVQRFFTFATVFCVFVLSKNRFCW